MRIIVFSGASGGHLFPALAFRAYFLARFPEARFFFVIPEGMPPYLKAGLLATGDEVFPLPDFPLSQILSLKAPVFLLKLAQGFRKTSRILNQSRPDALVAFGTFVGFPGILLGFFRKIPTVLHEQNCRLGKANRFLIPFATKVTVSFPPTLDRIPPGKGVWVGNILRPELVELAETVKKDGGKFCVLVLGGSQGSSFLNRLALETFRILSGEEKKKMAVVHITGAADFERLEHAYDGLGIQSEVFAFSEEMGPLYASCDLVVARAGAGVLAEIAVFGRASVLIPYPHAGSHQLENARYFAERRAACLLEEQEATPVRLREEMVRLAEDRERCRGLARRAGELAKRDAGPSMVDQVEVLLRERGEAVLGKRA